MPIVLGTAGHIDHGKTSLVRALTGIDCDRLEEERRRGITIELGFAHCALSDGTRVGIVDVPGHERFVKNMVAGAAGIDFVMLVVAADEGVMPQTREHLEICTLLGIRHGIVVLTKVDMVDPSLLEMAREDVHVFLQGTFLATAPVFTVSALTGEGIDALRSYIVQTAEQLLPERDGDIFRLPADRVFTMKGHGTVVTGTVLAGTIKVGDDICIMPGAIPSKVRGLQVHGENQAYAMGGQRCAINVQGVEVDAISRGAVLSKPQTLVAAKSFIVRVRCLSSAPRAIRNRTEVHFHHGAREVAARMSFWDRDCLRPGEEALAVARFAEPLVGVFGDRFVLRAYSPLRTIGGGMVVYPLEYALRRKDPAFTQKMAMLDTLSALAHTDIETFVLTHCRLVGVNGVGTEVLAVLTGLSHKRLEKALQTLANQGKVVCFDKEEKSWIDSEQLALLTEACLARAAAFHKKEPLKAGMARGVLLQGIAPKLGHMLLERCFKAKTLVSEGDVVRLPTHCVVLGAEQQGVRQQIYQTHLDGGLTPPNMKDVLEQLGLDSKKADPLIRVLLQEKLLVRVKDGLYYTNTALEDVKQRVRVWFETHDDLDLGGMKELLGGVSRKFLIALLEYLDSAKITVRVGDKRQWRGR